MTRKTRFAAIVIIVLLVASAPSSSQTGMRTFELSEGVTVSVPKDWILKDEKQLRAFEIEMYSQLEEYVFYWEMQVSGLHMEPAAPPPV